MSLVDAEQEGDEKADDLIRLDLSETRFVDHSTMEKLHQLEQDLATAGKRLELVGLENHKPLAGHALSARKSNGVGAGVGV